MQKLRSITAVLDESSNPAAVLDKAEALARRFEARVELLRVFPRSGRRLESPVLRHVRERNTDLVIKARAGTHPVRRATLAENDWSLSQQCPVPLMLVTDRPWSKVLRLAAAVDVSEIDTLPVARAVMQAAGFLALGCHGCLDILYTEREGRDDVLRMERAVRLAQLVREFHVGCERLQMFDGDPEKRLPPLFAARQYDVLLLGAVTHRSGLLDSLCSLTSRLVDATPGDVVLVNPDRPLAREELAAGGSAGEKVPHQGHQFV